MILTKLIVCILNLVLNRDGGDMNMELPLKVGSKTI